MRASNSRVQLRLLLVAQFGPVRELDARILQRGRDFLGEDARLPGDQLFDADPDRTQLLDLVESVGCVAAHAGRKLLLQAGYPDLEELVEVRAEDREELRPLEQGQRRVLGEREHARVEVEPGELAVEVARVLEGGISDDLRERHGPMVMAIRRAARRRSRTTGGWKEFVTASAGRALGLPHRRGVPVERLHRTEHA